MKTPQVRSFLVVGSGAAVGKTLVTCALVQSLCRAGVQAIAMKPAARGCIAGNGRWHSNELQQLAGVSAFGLPPHALCPYVVPSVRQAACQVDSGDASFEATIDTFRILSTWGDAVVIEGADELRQPLGLAFDSADLARELQLPFIAVVALRREGIEAAVRHAAALAARGLECAGWIANQPDRAASDDDELVAALARKMPGPCLGSIPALDVADPAAAARAIDIEGMMLALAPSAARRKHHLP